LVKITIYIYIYIYISENGYLIFFFENHDYEQLRITLIPDGGFGPPATYVLPTSDFFGLKICHLAMKKSAAKKNPPKSKPCKTLLKNTLLIQKMYQGIR
jgi:hypothetical protein